MAYTRATHQDILAWRQNFGIRAEHWELRTLMRLGMIWIGVMNEETITVARPPHG